jgi:hypothetical protein
MMLIILDAIKVVEVEVNAQKSKYIFIYRHKKVGQNHIVILRNCGKVTIFGTAVTNQIMVHDTIKSTFNSGNSCYNSLQNLLYFHFVSRNLKV